MLKALCVTSVSLAIFLSVSTPALAEISTIRSTVEVKQSSSPEINAKELEKFAAAMEDMREIQLESRDEISQAIRQEGLSQQRFREILKAQRTPEEEADASEEELQKFESATAQLAQIQRDTQSQMKEAVVSQGLEVARFQEILQSVRQDPQLKKQVQQLIREDNRN